MRDATHPISEERGLLRLITCGSVDHRRSALVERLSGNASLVAPGAFSSARRELRLTDVPSDEWDTRHLVAAASAADCALIIVDARTGVLAQARRHSFLMSLLGVSKTAVVVDGMDLVEYSEERFREIADEYAAFARATGIAGYVCIPTSGAKGDNVVEPSPSLAWFSGPSLLAYLEAVETSEARRRNAPFRLPIPGVPRRGSDLRSVAGVIAAGTIAKGDRIVVLPSGQRSLVTRVADDDGDLDVAVAGQPVTLGFEDEVDIGHGALIARPDDRPTLSDQFEATIIWTAAAPMLPGRDYLMRSDGYVAIATVTPLKYKLDVDTLEHLAATKLERDDVGVVALELDRVIAFDPFAENRETGGFTLVDLITNDTVGIGLLHFALRRSANVHWQASDVDKASRSALSGQRPALVWLTGLSGAGKSTIANLVESRLHGLGYHTYLLDGDNVRHGLNKDLGFTDADRVENIRRVGEVARLMVDAGLIVIASFISPFAAERRMVRALVEDGEFIEVHVDAPLALAEARDAKGLYGKARRGELKNFTGVDSPYERPEAPEVRVDTSALTPEEAAEQVIGAMQRAGVLERREH